MSTYRDDLQAAQEQVRALRAENERLKAPKVAPNTDNNEDPMSLSGKIALSVLFALTGLLIFVGVKCSANSDNVDYCYPKKVQCENPASIGCPDNYYLKYHRPWHDDSGSCLEGADGSCIVIAGKQAAMQHMKALGCSEVRP